MDDPLLWAVPLPPYDEPSAPTGDVPMVKSMEVMYIDYMLNTKEVEMCNHPNLLAPDLTIRKTLTSPIRGLVHKCKYPIGTYRGGGCSDLAF
jgi:hypothetical protein